MTDHDCHGEGDAEGTVDYIPSVLLHTVYPKKFSIRSDYHNRHHRC